MQEFICTKKQAKELDGLAFWAQNAVINWAENWRNISSHDLKQAMKSRGVIM